LDDVYVPLDTGYRRVFTLIYNTGVTFWPRRQPIDQKPYGMDETVLFIWCDGLNAT